MAINFDGLIPDENPDDNQSKEKQFTDTFNTESSTEEETEEDTTIDKFNFDGLEPDTDLPEKQDIKLFQDGIVKEVPYNSEAGVNMAADMILGGFAGIGNAIEETYDGLQTLGGVDEETIRQRNLIPEFYKPQTTAGQITEGGARFLTGFIPAVKVLKKAGLVAKSTDGQIGAAVKIGSRGMIGGAIADFSVWDPHEGRLSDMLIEFDSPALNNAVTQYLASDPDDSLAEGRLKNVLEGMLIGTPIELFLGIRAIQRARLTNDVNKKNKIYKEHGEAIQESLEEKTKVKPDEKVFKYVASLDDIKAKAKENNINLNIRQEDNYLILTRLEVDKADRKKGFGTEIMEDLMAYADRNQLTIGAGFVSKGSKISIQKRFFNKFGFVDNRGTINNDPNLNTDIYRRPEGKKIDTDTSYRGQHQPLNPDGGAARLDDVTKTPDGVPAGYPDDFYSANGKKYYADYSDAAKESYDIIQSVKGQPDATVTIYRAVPQGVNTINPGDFVTLSKKYADDHAASGYGRDGQQPGKVISEKVKVKDLFFDGNDVNEFGYFGERDIQVKRPLGDKAKRKLLEDNPAINVQALIKKFRSDGKDPIKDVELHLEDVFNMEKFKNADDLHGTIEDILRTIDDNAKNILTQGRLSNDIAEAIAKILARDPEEIMSTMPKITEFAREFPIRLLAHKIMLVNINKEYIRLSKLVARHTQKYGGEKISFDKQDAFKHFPDQAKQDVLDFMRVEDAMRDFIIDLKEQISNASAALNVGKVKVGADDAQFSINKQLDIRARYQHNPLKRALEISNMKPDDVPNAVAEVKAHKVTETFMSLYINSLLSGVVTNVINFGVGFFETFLRPAEQIIGGVFTRDVRSRRMGYNQYIGMMRTFLDIWSATGKALWKNQAILDPTSQTIDAFKVNKQGKRIDPLDPEYWEIYKGDALYTPYQVIGRILSVPSNLLTTVDELLKQSNYRGRLYAETVDGLIESGVSPGSKIWKDTLEKSMKDGFNADGSAATKNNPIAEESLEYARVNLFQNELADGSYLNWGASLQRFFNEQPSLRWIAPFIRTPTNLWRHQGNRVPGLGVVTKQMRELWNSGDSRKRSEVVGRQFFGVSVTMIAASYANEYILINPEEVKQGGIPKKLPKITGRGHADPKKNAALLAAGWRPYSILTQDDDGSWSYKQYNRMDPRFFIFGIVADISFIMDMNPDLTLFDDDPNNTNLTKDAALAAELISGTFASIARNITDKSYTKGIADTISILTDSSSYKLNRVVGNLVSGAIPFSALRKQLALDENAYDLRGLADKVLDGLGATGSLEYKRDIFGDPILKDKTTLYMNDGAMSFILQAPMLIGRKGTNLNETEDWLNSLARLGVSLELPKANSLHTKLDLTDYTITVDGKEQTALDYWREQMSKGGDDGSLRNAMRDLIMGSDFAEAGQGDQANPGGKEVMVRKLYDAYKQEAKGKLLERFPELAKDYEKAREDKFQFYNKDSSVVDQLRTY